MKYIDEYRDAAVVARLVKRIRDRITKPWVLMEICGGHTHAIMRYGLDQLLPPQLELVHGPGCPVCVTPIEIIDCAIEIASRPGVILISYGDMLRVPGSTSSLLRAKAAGADVRVAYSPLDAIRIAQKELNRRVVFLGIGFETTAPANAMAVWLASRQKLANFSMLVSHVLVPPAIRSILSSRSNRVRGFIAPGHVCSIMGFWEYEELAGEFDVPIVVGGFEPIDLLEAIAMLVDQLEENRAELENQYSRVVSRNGNAAARALMHEVFETTDRNWRGIGEIANSGYRLRQEYAAYDAERVFEMSPRRAVEVSECISAEILKGLKKPMECPAFGIACTPLQPMGASMVSSEGICAAYYTYRRHHDGL